LKAAESIEDQKGFLAYLRLYFGTAPFPSRAFLFAYFAVFLITPVLGEPEPSGDNMWNSVAVVVGLSAVLVLSSISVFHFNRGLKSEVRKTGRLIAMMIVVPTVVFLLSTLISIVTADAVISLTRAAVSFVVVVPLVIVILVLGESILTGRDGSRRFPIFLAFLAIFLIIYSFGTIFFINGLLANPNGDPVSFIDSLYVSGLSFTTLGYTDVLPVGVGKSLAIFEAISGYMVLGLIAAIFIENVIQSRE
jgi:hypothetical protein